LSWTTRVSRYQKKHSLTRLSWSSSNLYQLLPSTTIHSVSLRTWQSFCITCLQVLFGLALGLEPSTSYSIHFFTQSVFSFRNTSTYHRSLFCCSTGAKIISFIPDLSLTSLLGTIFYLNTLTSRIHLTILISVRWSASEQRWECLFILSGSAEALEEVGK